MANNQNLKPFPPGQTGNPKGRGKGIENSATRLKRMFKLTSLIKNPVTGKDEKFTVLEQMDLAQINAARKGNTLAYRELLDRYEGKAKQSMELEGNLTARIIIEDTKNCQPLINPIDESNPGI